MTAPPPDLDVLKAENTGLRELAKKLGNTLMDFTPGGSEYFIHRFDDYFADADECKRIIADKIDTLRRQATDFARERNELRRTTEKQDTRIRKLEGALRGNPCPYPTGQMAADNDTTVRHCVALGTCTCDNAAALSTGPDKERP